MRADGSEQRRLTHVPGYDGGPFYFPDGSRIIWRRFSEDGLVADVWSMNPDGSDQRQLTDFGAMSWAPYVHPSLEYVLFASNKLGFSNFEVYMVDVAGEKEPVRITTTDGFDGLPVPTPDGEGLAWTSTRHGGEGGQIYLADWDHEAALAALRSAPSRNRHTETSRMNRRLQTLTGVSLSLALLLTLPAAGQTPEELRDDVLALTGPGTEGRAVGTPGAATARRYLISELEAAGARPLPGRDGLGIPFRFIAGVEDRGSSLRAGGHKRFRKRPGEGVRVLGDRRGAGRALFRRLRHPRSGERRGPLRQLRRPRGSRQGGGRPPLLPGRRGGRDAVSAEPSRGLPVQGVGGAGPGSGRDGDDHRSRVRRGRGTGSGRFRHCGAGQPGHPRRLH